MSIEYENFSFANRLAIFVSTPYYMGIRFKPINQQFVAGLNRNLNTILREQYQKPELKNFLGNLVFWGQKWENKMHIKV